MILVLHPEQMRTVLDLAADLNLPPEDVANDLFGFSPSLVLSLPPLTPSPHRTPSRSPSRFPRSKTLSPR